MYTRVFSWNPDKKDAIDFHLKIKSVRTLVSIVHSKSIARYICQNQLFNTRIDGLIVNEEFYIHTPTDNSRRKGSFEGILNRILNSGIEFWIDHYNFSYSDSPKTDITNNQTTIVEVSDLVIKVRWIYTDT